MHMYAQNISSTRYLVGYNSITIIYLGRPYKSITFISDTPESITLQYSCMLYRKDARERAGVQNAKALASCVTVSPKGNLVISVRGTRCCCCFDINSHNQVRGYRTGSSHSGALELRNTPGKKHKPKMVHAYVTADAIHASTRNIV